MGPTKLCRRCQTVKARSEFGFHKWNCNPCREEVQAIKRARGAARLRQLDEQRRAESAARRQERDLTIKKLRSFSHLAPLTPLGVRLQSGAVGEAMFFAEAVRNGLVVSKPNLDVGYDYVTDGGGVLKRVQVKFCGVPRSSKGTVFGVHTYTRSRDGVQCSYRDIGVDVMALHIAPTGDWYLVPTAEIHGKNITVNPMTGGGQYERFKNNWSVLKDAVQHEC